MPHTWIRYAVAGLILIPLIGVSRAQSPPAHDAWFMQNYRFAGPPPPGELKSVDPVLTELREIQSKVLTILRRARLERDYEAALAAAAQAVANAQLIGAMTERQQATQAGELAKSATDEAQSPAQFFLIALKDRTINAVTSYWVDGPMLNYITLPGAHVMVRLDLVDLGLSRELNRQRNVEFRLPPE
jgi:hypothetical protein